jgi:hypothetical protein
MGNHAIDEFVQALPINRVTIRYVEDRAHRELIRHLRQLPFRHLRHSSSPLLAKPWV